LIPPTIEEGHLHNGKFIFGMVDQLAYHSINSILDSCELSAHIASVKIIIDGLEPSYIIMGMGDKVDGEFRSIFRV
jgi:hypothetical protein